MDAQSLTAVLDMFKKIDIGIDRQNDVIEKIIHPGKDISVTQRQDLMESVG